MRKTSSGKMTSPTPTVIAEGTHVVGDLKFCGTLIVEGEVTGNILSLDDEESRVTILDKGLVRGEVRTPSVMISGRIKGDIYADKLVQLASRAVIEGDVHYAVLEVERGAQVNGSLVQGSRDKDARSEAPVLDDEDSQHNEHNHEASRDDGELGISTQPV